MKPAIAMPLTMLLLCLAAHGQTPATLPSTIPSGIDAQLWDRMKSIDAKAAAINDLTADFTQRKFTPLLKKPMESAGQVLARGSVMLWITQSPRPTMMYVDEKEIELYYPDQKTLEIYPTSGPLAAMIASPVPRLAELLSRFKFDAGQAQDRGPDFLALQMTPTDATIRQYVEKVSVLLDANHGVLNEFTVTDADGASTEMRFANIKINSGLDLSRLKLDLPSDVKVVHPSEMPRQ